MVKIMWALINEPTEADMLNLVKERIVQEFLISSATKTFEALRTCAMACCLVSRELKSRKQDDGSNSGQLKAAMGVGMGDALDYTIDTTG